MDAASLPPVTLFLDGDEQFEVDCVLEVRTTKSKKHEFLVKWQGYGPEHNTWEPELNLLNCSDVLQAFWNSRAPRGPGRAAKARGSVH